MAVNLDQVITNAASGLSAQSIRMNTIASNLANANTVGSTEQSTYHAKYPIFSEVTQRVAGLSSDDQPIGGVRVTGIETANIQLEKQYDPENPKANSDGYVYRTDVNPVTQLTDMISASKEYQALVEVMKTARNLMTQTLTVMKDK